MKHLFLLAFLCMLIAPRAPAKSRYRANGFSGSVLSLAAQSPAANSAILWEPAPAGRFNDPQRSRKHTNPDDTFTSIAEGNVALIAAVLSIVSLVALSLTSFPLFLIGTFVFGVAAVVLGAVGVRRHKKGIAIAGLALGLLSIIGGFIALAVL